MTTDDLMAIGQVRLKLEWRPVAIAPKDGRWILAYLHDCGDHLPSCDIFPVKWTGEYTGWTTRGVCGINITHWMPLPEEP